MAAREFPVPVVLAVAFQRPEIAGENGQEAASDLVRFMFGNDQIAECDPKAALQLCSQELFKQFPNALVDASWEIGDDEDPKCYALRMTGLLGEAIEVLPIGESTSEALL